MSFNYLQEVKPREKWKVLAIYDTSLILTVEDLQWIIIKMQQINIRERRARIEDVQDWNEPNLSILIIGLTFNKSTMMWVCPLNPDLLSLTIIIMFLKKKEKIKLAFGESIASKSTSNSGRLNIKRGIQ